MGLTGNVEMETKFITKRYKFTYLVRKILSLPLHLNVLYGKNPSSQYVRSRNRFLWQILKASIYRIYHIEANSASLQNQYRYCIINDHTKLSAQRIFPPFFFFTLTAHIYITIDLQSFWIKPVSLPLLPALAFRWEHFSSEC